MTCTHYAGSFSYACHSFAVQNLALNIAEKGFPISVWNRSTSKVDDTVERAKKEGNLPLRGFHDAKDFVLSIQKPRCVLSRPNTDDGRYRRMKIDGPSNKTYPWSALLKAQRCSSEE